MPMLRFIFIIREIPTDPWDNPYTYMNIASAVAGFDDIRKDKNLNPLNSDFDLYSVGRDGESAVPLSAEKSHDDIVRINNGAFIGLAKDY